MSDYKPRSLSKVESNKAIVKQIRCVLMNKYVQERNPEKVDFGRKSRFTFILPNINQFSEEKKALIINDLIDRNFQKKLEKKSVINWWLGEDLKEELIVLKTNSGVNSLVDAISLAIWGFQDKFWILRRALRNAMINSYKLDDFLKRFINSSFFEAENATHEDIASEWDYYVELIETSAKNERILKRKFDSNESYSCEGESMYSIHIFILSYILKRPIVVLETEAEEKKDKEEEVGYTRGVYLPLDREPRHCYKNPIFICYHRNYFKALVFMNKNNEYGQMHRREFLIPLVNCKNELLPVPFAFHPEYMDEIRELTGDEEMELISKYMDVIEIHRTPSSEEEDNKNSGKNDDDDDDDDDDTDEDDDDDDDDSFSYYYCCKMIVKRPNFINIILNNYLDNLDSRIEQMKTKDSKKLQDLVTSMKNHEDIKSSSYTSVESSFDTINSYTSDTTSEGSTSKREVDSKDK